MWCQDPGEECGTPGALGGRTMGVFFLRSRAEGGLLWTTAGDGRRDGSSQVKNDASLHLLVLAALGECVGIMLQTGICPPPFSLLTEAFQI